MKSSRVYRSLCSKEPFNVRVHAVSKYATMWLVDQLQQLVSDWMELQRKQLLERTQWQEDASVNKVSDSTVSQVLLWLWDGGSSGTQEGEHSPLEAGNRGLVRDSRPEV
jgi:hypothetical protein